MKIFKSILKHIYNLACCNANGSPSKKSYIFRAGMYALMHWYKYLDYSHPFLLFETNSRYV